MSKGRQINVADELHLFGAVMQRNVTLVRPFINLEVNSPFFLPIGLLSIGASAREAGHNVRLLDFEFEHRTRRRFSVDEPLETFVSSILATEPDVVGITVLADTLPMALALGSHLKMRQPNSKVVLGGPGIHGMAQAIASRFSNSVDYICLAGGETALCALLSSNLEIEIQGMLKAGHTEAPAQPQVIHLDSLPFPAYDLLDVESYLAIASPRIFDLHVGSGCTYKCSFCTTAPFWSNTFSARSPASILSEMEYLDTKYGITEFNLIHDNFANNKSYINDFLDYFIRHNRNYSWGCAVRPDNAPLDMMKRMKSAGCKFLFIGTDAGDAAILRDMRKMTSSAKSYRFFTDAREADLQFETNTIIGYPNENDDALESSLKIVFDAIAYGAYTADISVLQPLPGTPVTKLYKDSIEPTYGIFPIYTPNEAKYLIDKNRDIFTGFGFIRFQNRPYLFYTNLAQVIRFFTRHFFRSIYFIKEKLGIPYREILAFVGQNTSPLAYEKSLVDFAGSLDVTADQMATLNDIIAFESALEHSKAVDLVAQIANIYSSPEQQTDRELVSVDVNCEVHLMFSSLPEIRDVPLSRTSYLFVRTGVDVATVRLKDWQRVLWQEFKKSKYNALEFTVSNDWVLDLAVRSDVPESVARNAINAAIDMFTCKSSVIPSGTV
jgi:radical SAM superfamily enzyme YgiQ (UPF0313 family)